MALLDNDITACLADLRTFPWWGGLDAVRQRALVDMRFQLGPAGFRGFRKMLAALAIRNYAAAAHHARDSKWARTDSPTRATTITAMLESGKEPTL
jgi:lysozyme